MTVYLKNPTTGQTMQLGSHQPDLIASLIGQGWRELTEAQYYQIHPEYAPTPTPTPTPAPTPSPTPTPTPTPTPEVLTSPTGVEGVGVTMPPTVPEGWTPYPQERGVYEGTIPTTTPTTGGTMATTVTQAANGIWWVNVNGQWKMYDPNDPVGSDITLAQLQTYQAQVSKEEYYAQQAESQYQPPPPLPTQQPDGGFMGGVGDFFGTGGTNTMPTQPIGQITPEQAFGYGGVPQAGWLNRLMAGGMYGYSPAQQWAYNQYDPTMKNFEIANQFRMLQGQPETTWGQAPFRSSLDPGLWGQMLGIQGTQAGQDWIGQRPQEVWDIGVGSLGGGRVTPGTNWLQYQYPLQRNLWTAQHQPGVQGTTGTSWLDYLKGYMGL